MLGGFAPLIATALSLAFGSILPIIIFAAVVVIIGVVATAYASFRPDASAADRDSHNSRSSPAKGRATRSTQPCSCVRP